MKRMVFSLLLLSCISLSARQYALISVSDKTGIEECAQRLVDAGYHIISTGGTFAHLAKSIPSDCLHQVTDITQFPELLDGRLKTLDPHIHGGILAKRSSDEHMNALEQYAIPRIDIVIVNLYPFQNVIAHENVSLDAAIENIDIGGVALIRAAAKNYHDVLVVTDPNDYERLTHAIENNNVTDQLRKKCAIKAFASTAQYDGAISGYLSNGAVMTRQYQKSMPLKYGLNPHQKQAAVYTLQGHESPLHVLNGQLGFINILDALQSWQLVCHARAAFELPVCASFKHVSPAGVGLGIPLSQEDMQAFQLRNTIISPVACAFVRARNGDPKSSFGDWIAVSDEVDEQTARLIKVEVSDGIIAPSYTPEAFKILKQKKRGSYPIIEIDPAYTNEQILEFRELFGIGIGQQPNDLHITDDLLKNVVTQKSIETSRDLKLAMITLKYTQSNSVVYTKDGQVIGVGSGQQSRVDCVRLAGKKALLWMLRRHPKVHALQFKQSVKRPERNNAIVQFIKGDAIDDLLCEPQPPLAKADRELFLKSQRGISLASDAFFPFEDNIEHAARFGVEYIVQPGGSIRDTNIIAACDAQNIAMVCNGMRLFTH